MSNDPYSSSADSADDPSAGPYAFAASDTVELPVIPKAIYVGTGGDVTLRAIRSAADVVFRNCPSGSILPVRARFVRAAGTTASDFVALA